MIKAGEKVDIGLNIAILINKYGLDAGGKLADTTHESSISVRRLPLGVSEQTEATHHVAPCHLSVRKKKVLRKEQL